MLYLEVTTKRCVLKYTFFKIQQTRPAEERYEHITTIEKIDIIVLVISALVSSIAIHTTMSSHVLKWSYQADFKLVCRWDLRRLFLCFQLKLT